MPAYGRVGTRAFTLKSSVHTRSGQRRITEEMYDKKPREYKERQGQILVDMRIYSEADEEFYLTANIVLNVAKRALEIFKSSEVPEKRQFLNFLLQNCELQGKNRVYLAKSV